MIIECSLCGGLGYVAEVLGMLPVEFAPSTVCRRCEGRGAVEDGVDLAGPTDPAKVVTDELQFAIAIARTVKKMLPSKRNHSEEALSILYDKFLSQQKLLTDLVTKHH